MFWKPATVSLSALAFAALGVTAAQAQGYTTRIEPRPFYGATVTLEEGVRVIRPLPPVRQVIINPDNATPLTLGFHETRVYENRTIRNYNSGDGSSSSGAGNTRRPAGYYFGGYGPGRYGGNHAVPQHRGGVGGVR
ncbi:MAG: hypothetical protein WBP38_07180 [Hyphomicrobium sp.]|nr:hypothetical protein [Hyphomicrobium sp.]